MIMTRIETNTSVWREALKRLSAKTGVAVYRNTAVNGMVVGVQLENGDEWMMTSSSFKPFSEIVFEKFVPNFS